MKKTQTLHERFSSALFHGARAWRLALDKRLKHLGLGQAGWTTLAIVAKSDEPLSQSELAQRVGVEGATMVTTIDRLVEAGLVERQVSPDDRRIKLVSLTKAGWKQYDVVRQEAEAFRNEILSEADEKLLLKATELLETLRDNVEAGK
jgi:MarR family transcriptional regulator for hemolysin